MVHEILGIKNHRVDLTGVPGIKRDMQVSKSCDSHMTQLGSCDSHMAQLSALIM